jgi:hypothetical protein
MPAQVSLGEGRAHDTCVRASSGAHVAVALTWRVDRFRKIKGSFCIYGAEPEPQMQCVG